MAYGLIINKTLHKCSGLTLKLGIFVAYYWWKANKAAVLYHIKILIVKVDMRCKGPQAYVPFHLILDVDSITEWKSTYEIFLRDQKTIFSRSSPKYISVYVLTISVTRLVVLFSFLAVLSVLSRTCVPWFLKLMISLSSQVCNLSNSKRFNNHKFS